MHMPITNAAGMVKTRSAAAEFLQLPVPEVLLGSYTLEEREINQGTVFHNQSGFGSVNSLGLPGGSLEKWKEDVSAVVEDAAEHDIEVWASVAGFSPSEFETLTAAAFEAGADGVEVNMGCPNILIEGGGRKPIPSYNPDLMADGLGHASLASEGKPLRVKVSAILDEGLLAEVAAAVNETHDVVSVATMNTIANCRAVDTEGNSIISSPDGLAGMGGPALKWLALGQATQWAKLLRDGISIVGVGGVSNGNDVRDFLAIDKVDRVQVATAVWNGGPRALLGICEEYANYL